MQTEARLARRLGFRIATGGGTRDGAETAARLLVAEGALALVSFGLAGGLQPPLHSGKVLVHARSSCGPANALRPMPACRRSWAA